MNERYSTIHLGTYAALIFSFVLIPGCGVSIRPDNIPVLQGYENVSLTGASLLVTSTEQDSSEYVVRNDSGAKSGITANRYAWSKMFVQALAGELARRGSRSANQCAAYVEHCCAGNHFQPIREPLPVQSGSSGHIINRMVKRL
jgi:hypothetical protein